MIESYNPRNLTTRDLLLFDESICKNKYLLLKPYSRQSWPIFEINRPLRNNEPNEELVGAGGFGGKTVAGTMLAGQYLDVEDYTCLVTRLNYAELTGPDSIWENSCNWFCDEDRLGDHTCTSHDGKLRIRSPFGSTIWFKAFDSKKKKQKVKSESYDRIINDEASELDPNVLTFLYRSLRNAEDSPIPLGMINLSNPGGPSTEYLLKKFVDGTKPYFPLDWRHNPYINKKVYSKTLDNLDFIDQQYQKYGDWHYRPARGELFKEKTLKDSIIDEMPDIRIVRTIRGTDMAVTRKGDYSAFVKWQRDERGHLYIVDVKWIQTEYPEDILEQCVLKDNPAWEQGFTYCEYFLEKEGGSSATHQMRYIHNFMKAYIKAGIQFIFIPSTVNKFTRARPLANAFRQGKISILKADWNKAFIDELKDFGPDDREYEHDDQVDAASIGYNQIGTDPGKYSTTRKNYAFSKLGKKDRLKQRRVYHG